MLPGVQKSVREKGKKPSHSQMNSHVGSCSPGGLPNFQRTISGVKTQWIEEFFLSFKIY
jgi:hypothetical protein